MKTLSLSLLFLLSSHAVDEPGQKAFGEAITLTEPVRLADAMADPSPYKDKEILIEGKVFKVCKKKGCWMLMGDSEKNIRVTFKDYSFFVPKASVGKRARAQGMIVEETLSVKAARHFLKDEGASKDDIKSIKEPMKTTSFIASGVQFLD